MDRPAAPSRLRTNLALLLVVFPILASTAVLLSQLRPIPMLDDYQALVSYSVSFQQLTGFWSHIALPFTHQHDEYKLIFEHLIEALDLAVSGHIHYRFLAILGNLFAVAILVPYWRQFFTGETLVRRALLFAPISLLLMQLNYVETLDWAMCGLQMIPVIFFSILALQLLCEGTARDFALGCLAAFFACLASANGFAVAPVGVLVLLQLRKYRRIVPWGIPFVVVGAIYSYHYGSTLRGVTVPNPTLLQKLYFFLSFLGGALENLHHIPFRGMSVIVGTAVVIAAVYALRTRYDQTHPFAFYVGVWILTTALGVAQFRIRLGIDGALANRYKIYSDLALIFVYGLVVESLRGWLSKAANRRFFYLASMFLCTVLYLSSGYFGFKFLKTRRVRMDAGFRNYLKDPDHVSPEVTNNGAPIFTSEPEFSRKVMNQAISDGVYRVPAYLLPDATK